MIAALAAVGIVPLLLLGWASYRSSREALERTIGADQAQLAEELARSVERVVADSVSGLQLAVGYIPFRELGVEERSAVLAVPFQQLAAVNVLALLDERGDAACAPRHGRTGSPGVTPSHEPMQGDDLAAFAAHIPLKEAFAAGAAVGPPYRAPHGKWSRIAVAVRVDSEPPRVLAAELSLAELQQRLQALSVGGLRVRVLDAAGAAIADGGNFQGSGAEVALAAALPAREAPRSEVLEVSGEPPILATVASVRRLGWRVMLSRPTSEAFRSAETLGQLTAVWAVLALLLTLGLGSLLGRRLAVPVATLATAARKVAEGDYEQRVPDQGSDEFAGLGRAFNAMASEIRRWNGELLARVEAKSRELREAQEQVLRARRLSALASLGAGVAHELNNPLTAIIGLVTLAKRGLAPGAAQLRLLDSALEQSRRVAKIVADLRQLTDREREEQGLRLALAPRVSAALDALAPALVPAQITLERRLDPKVEVQGQGDQLESLVGHLAQNAINAMPRGGRLTVSVERGEGSEVRLVVADTGAGIPKALRDRVFDPFFTTKSTGTSVGLGLTVCHSIVEAHHGRILLDSAEGAGTTVTVLLPAAPELAHLY